MPISITYIAPKESTHSANYKKARVLWILCQLLQAEFKKCENTYCQMAACELSPFTRGRGDLDVVSTRS